MARGRPRRHDREELLDHARALWAEHGATGLTMRALSARSGAGNGAIYHAFGSRDGVRAAVWAREAARFLDHQRALVDAALADGGPRAAVRAAALALADYAETDEESARLLLAVRPDDLLADDLGPEQRAEQQALRDRVGALLVELAGLLWDRTDPTAVRLVRHCVVDLPGRLLLDAGRVGDPVARHAVTCAVDGVTAAAPPAG